MVFENIKAFNYKDIIEIELLDLSTINVICGKNGSGKSALLEAISNKERCSVWIFPDFDEMFNSCIKPQLEAYRGTIADYGTKWITDFFKKHFSKNKLIFSDEGDEFVKTLMDDFKFSPLESQYRLSGSINFSTPLHEYCNKISSNYKPVLIPPKRNIKRKLKLI